MSAEPEPPANGFSTEGEAGGAPSAPVEAASECSPLSPLAPPAASDLSRPSRGLRCDPVASGASPAPEGASTAPADVVRVLAPAPLSPPSRGLRPEPPGAASSVDGDTLASQRGLTVGDLSVDGCSAGGRVGGLGAAPRGVVLRPGAFAGTACEAAAGVRGSC